MRRQTSTNARYLRARLRPLTRPVFWGPAIALVLVMLFTWDFWTSPTLLSYFGISNPSDKSKTDSSNDALSSEDRAIGADIDALPLLLNDIGISANATSPSQSLLKAESSQQTTNLVNLQGVPLAGSTTAQSQTATTGPFSRSETPLTGDLQKLSANSNSFFTDARSGEQQPGAIAKRNLFGTISQQQLFSNTLLNPAAATPNAAQTALETALAQSASANKSRPSGTPASFTATPTSSPAFATPIEGTTSLGSFGVNATVPNNSNATNSYTNLIEGSQPIRESQSSFSTVAPTVPSIVPSAVPVVPGQPVLPNQGLGASPNAFTSQPSTEVIPPSDLPLSAPRPIPGRFIGGGQINTFSNP